MITGFNLIAENNKKFKSKAPEPLRIDVAKQLAAIKPVGASGAGYWLFQCDCLVWLAALAEANPDGLFDAIFADPPYFLSNGGITCEAGRMVKVDKGNWDKSRGAELDHAFNLAWLTGCQNVLKPNGTIWVSGTSHVIHSVGYAMRQLNYKMLNDITWEKPNPPPNLSCRCFTHATETVLWAAKGPKSRHVFNYQVMRTQAGGKQMKSVWRMTSPSRSEKMLGKHRTQKPVALIERCLLASTPEGAVVLDPFMGSGTTGVACLRNQRQFVGVESDKESFVLARRRLRHEEN